MSVFERLTNFVREVFKTNLEIFLEAVRLSPNAQGYVSGSITELLLKKKLEEELGFEVKRIREKWEGRKHPNHHGDFYFRKLETQLWFVLESKGVKSNSEKWHKLYNYENLKKFLINHADKIFWIDHQDEVENQVVGWINESLPRFQDDFAASLYDYEEVQKYLQNLPRKETPRSRAVLALRNYSREQISNMINERLDYVKSKVKVLETHFPVGISGSSQRTQATPRKDEFNIVSIDIFLRFPEHKFLFANPKQLESSGDDPNHLQQNYVIGFVFTDEQGNHVLSLTEEWSGDFKEVYQTLNEDDSISEEDMQVDTRKVILLNDAD
jgi:hypothetical protein